MIGKVGALNIFFIYFPFKKGSVVCDLLPPPSNEDAVTSRSTKGEDRVGGTGVAVGASRAPPDFSSFRGKTISFKRPPVPLSPPEFSDLPPVLEDDLLPVLSPPEGYRDGPLHTVSFQIFRSLSIKVADS